MALGLSVLIPVFNCDVNELVDSLLAQQTAWPGPVEILLFDDGSAENIRTLNRPLAHRPGVRYHELAHNVGRAAIRNRLAAAAQQEWLLLLDNDSLLPDARFLARYAAACHRAPVLIGGTCYTTLPPRTPLCTCAGTTAKPARPAPPRRASSSPTPSSPSTTRWCRPVF
ncbi:glycosyltransferase family 2 protein [Hymenobacter sedentarius]|uniref:glycosyltransferase family 2 protein n=1 Tax=Hymenobacter sedentarius TaxID=1411621 RepID=UPI0009005839|nr:glycosyltransferase [Hymenobacter sedentarius]